MAKHRAHRVVVLPHLLHSARPLQGSCFWRMFHEYNATGYTHWTYSIESALHEFFLQSAHRTLDPDQADFFYVPVYTSCFFHPVLAWADFPFWYGNGGEAFPHHPALAAMPLGSALSIASWSSCSGAGAGL